MSNLFDNSELVFLWEALEGQCSPEEKQALLDRLRREPELRETLAGLKGVRRDLAAEVKTTAIDPPADLKEKVLRAALPLVSRVGRSRRVVRREKPILLRMAAAALIVGVSVGLWVAVSQPNQEVVALVREYLGRPGVRLAHANPPFDYAPGKLEEGKLREIREGDVLYTEALGAAYFKFPDCGEFFMAPWTELEVLATEGDELEDSRCRFRLLRGMVWSTQDHEKCRLAIVVGSEQIVIQHTGAVCVLLGEDGELEVGHVHGEVVRQVGDGAPQKIASTVTSEQNLYHWLDFLDSERLTDESCNESDLQARIIQTYDIGRVGFWQVKQEMEMGLRLAPKLRRPVLVLAYEGQIPEWTKAFTNDPEIQKLCRDVVCIKIDVTEGSEEWLEKWNIEAPAFLVHCPYGAKKHGTVSKDGSLSELQKFLQVACEMAKPY